MENLNLLMNKYSWFFRVKGWYLRNLKNIFWIILTIYVFLNWEKCISMEFFKNFNGNNILFIVWLLMIIFDIYDIEIKGFKMSKRKHKIDIANFQYEMNNTKVNLENCQNEIDNVKQKIEESGKNQNREDI